MNRNVIRVAAVFSPNGTIKPVWFDWQGERHTIQEITYRWESNLGRAQRLHFTTTADTGLYELVYNTLEQIWTVREFDNLLRPNERTCGNK